MRTRFIGPRDIAQPIASHLPIRQQFASEVIAAVREPAVTQRDAKTRGQRP
jgi:hypothetical protein